MTVINTPPCLAGAPGPMNADKLKQAIGALNDLQEKLFDAAALLRCLDRALEADGHNDQARAANAISDQVSAVAIALGEVLS